MESRERSAREVAFPAAALATLRRSLIEEAGAPATTHALHAAGYGAGEALYPLFAGALGGEPAARAEEAFWGSFREFLARRGWGTLEHARVHPGVGLLTSFDWAEATAPAEEAGSSCAFSSGLLSGLLSKVAGGPIAVLDVSGRHSPGGPSRFAFGSETAIGSLHGLLSEGVDLDSALGRL